MKKTQFGWRRLIALFLVSKVFILSLSSLASNIIAPNSAGSQIFLAKSDEFGRFDSLVKMLVQPLIQWDGLHFMAIARNGYIFENQFAFFPLLPMTSRAIADLAGKFGLAEHLSLEARIALFGIFLANLSHLLAVILLYK